MVITKLFFEISKNERILFQEGRKKKWPRYLLLLIGYSKNQIVKVLLILLYWPFVTNNTQNLQQLGGMNVLGATEL
jgi:hypothetical protein